ncbi:lipoprotein insertase outer membrane protein LolB [Colwellia sp. 1_MG-2023]|uniref:lipoprotein insertase outer membrane protein LolB n=1 Tax=Colwellia sp. 1_MG-2023 TaxID=3062649 RepID=UPI0026E2D86C|nr:lipoprotein insertase outer membrane protein LolB [Colwellia sp. 1_MG-2023]MDO6446448.1 lipoprotein insertase outer membrane protein LolB [Colwellia sp. 1_MG-2023]
MTKNIIALLCLLLLLHGCASNKIIERSSTSLHDTKEARLEKLKHIQQWQIKGKIAFLQKNKRESASLFWQYHQDTGQQTLKLTTYLGINVLTLHTDNGQHRVEIDGENYQSDNLEQLIYSLTGLILPTNALNYWLKGQVYSAADTISYDKQSELPNKLTSYYQGNIWQISYKKYQQVNDVSLAHQLSIKQNDLTIKIMINQWKL